MWHYQNQPFIPPDPLPVAMVYCITNTVNGRKYIGKKGFWSSKTKQVKGRKKRFKVESDWQNYYGSSKELLTDIEKYGLDKFHREVLYLCQTKGEASYLEAKEQFDRNVLLDERYYNQIVNCRVASIHLPKSLIMEKLNG